MADQLLTIEQVSEWLQIPVRRLRTWVAHPHRSGEPPLPVVKVGGSLRYRRSDVETWLQASTVTPRPHVVRSRRAS